MTKSSQPSGTGVVRQLLALLVVGAAVVLVISGVRTSQAEVTASTSSTGLFSAGSVDIRQVGDSVELLFDEELLYPGSKVDACVVVAYRGSIPADVRLHGLAVGGTGLDEHIQFDVWLTEDPCPVADPPGRPLFDRTLADLWRTHGSYDTGLRLGTDWSTDSQVTLVATAELLDDPEIAGLYTDFYLVVEARP